jgi:hypothetical protein
VCRDESDEQVAQGCGHQDEASHALTVAYRCPPEFSSRQVAVAAGEWLRGIGVRRLAFAFRLLAFHPSVTLGDLALISDRPLLREERRP